MSDEELHARMLDLFLSIVKQFLFELPMIIVALIGIFVSLFNLRRATIPAILSILGFLGILALHAMCPVFEEFQRSGFRNNPRDMQLSVGAIDLGFSFVNAFALILVIIAIFHGRKGVESAKLASGKEAR